MFAFPEKAKPIAVVVPVEKTLRLLVEKNNIANKYSDLPDLVKLQSVRDLVMEDMIASGKAAGLQGIELVSGIVLASDIWTPENVSPSTLGWSIYNQGLVTAAMKLSRKNIEKLFGGEIQVHSQMA